MPDKVDAFSASNYYISQFYHLAHRLGLKADTLYEEAGVPLQLIDQPGVRVSADKLSFIVVSIWDLLGDEALKLASDTIPRGAFQMMGSLTVHEPTLHDAIRTAAKFYAMVSKAYTLRLDDDQGTATLRCEFTDPGLDPMQLFAELTLMGWHRYFSWLIAENIIMDTVYFHYSPPQQIEEYAYLFPGRHEFNAGFLGFSFPSHLLSEKTVQDVDSLKVFMKNCPAELFLQPRQDFSLTGAIRRVLQSTLKQGMPTIEQVAEEFNLTKRTLIRKLTDEGTSYQVLKDAIRRDRAMHLLSKRSLSIAEIAEQVGFSDSAVFARAFKTWSGKTPRAFQQTINPKDPSINDSDLPS